MNKRLKVMAHVALLIAIEVVLSRFCSLSTQIGKLGLAFAPLAVCGMLFGPWWGCLAGALADFIGAILFPIGPYFPGFTLSNALAGFAFGLLLYKSFLGWKRVAVAVVINNFVISLFLTTWWINLLYGSPYLGILPTRIFQSVVMTVLEFIVIRLLQKPMGAYARQLRL